MKTSIDVFSCGDGGYPPCIGHASYTLPEALTPQKETYSQQGCPQETRIYKSILNRYGADI